MQMAPDEPVDPWTGAWRRGDFESAWQISDAVLRSQEGAQCWDLPRHLQRIWDGSSPAGKRVLVRCYHGLGDTVQFIRYAPLLRAIAAEVIVWAQPALLELLRSVHGIDRLLPLHDGRPETDYDLDIEIMELPHLFRTTLATVPADIPYLRAPPAETVKSDGTLQLGVVWRAGDWDARRSVPIALLEAWAAVPGIRLHALQRGSGLSDWSSMLGPVAGSDDILATAGTVQALDLMISVDSFPAHLAGALGRPVWTLLHSHADWRWLEDREDSPWYPTMRLFRQTHPGDWKPVVARVADALRELVAAERPTAHAGRA
jgi:hypothetical protein